MNIRTYSELITLSSFEERFQYLKLDGIIGDDTFGFLRYLNQRFYRSIEWRRVRDQVIVRDNGCDLGLEDYPVYGKVLIHHMNPITQRDILDRTDLLFNPEYLVCVSHTTHNAIHYGNESMIPKSFVERYPNDTCPWRK